MSDWVSNPNPNPDPNPNPNPDPNPDPNPRGSWAVGTIACWPTRGNPNPNPNPHPHPNLNPNSHPNPIRSPSPSPLPSSPTTHHSPLNLHPHPHLHPDHLPPSLTRNPSLTPSRRRRDQRGRVPPHHEEDLALLGAPAAHLQCTASARCELSSFTTVRAGRTHGNAWSLRDWRRRARRTPRRSLAAVRGPLRATFMTRWGEGGPDGCSGVSHVYCGCV